MDRGIDGGGIPGASGAGIREGACARGVGWGLYIGLRLGGCTSARSSKVELRRLANKIVVIAPTSAMFHTSSLSVQV